MLTPSSSDHENSLSAAPDRVGGSWLDRPALTMLALNGEKVLYGLIVLLAVFSRFWNLGQHLMSHDETVHANWSWYLYQGHGYQHHPLSHGPFLFHVTALSYYLFGDNDFTARLAVAVLGVVLTALPYTLRHWLGRSGALVASFLFLISPSVLYYSRYIRNDVPIVLWALIAVLAIFRYLGEVNTDGRLRWLVLLAAALSLMFATKEVSFFYIAILGLFLVILFFSRLGAPSRESLARRQWRHICLTVVGLLAVIVVASAVLLSAFFLVELFPVRYRDCGQAPVPSAAPGAMGCTDEGCDLIQGRCQRPLAVVASNDVPEFDPTGTRVAIRLTWLDMWFTVLLIGAVTVMTGGGAYLVLRGLMPFQSGERPALDLVILIGTFTLPFLVHIAISGLSGLVSRALFGVDAAFDSLDYSEAGLLRSAGFAFVLLAVSTAVGLWWDWRRWLVTAGVFYGIFVLLFTTVFTNGNGLASGMVGSLGYWMGQQAVERGSQPLYYYGLMISLYEFLPLVGSVAAALFLFRHRRGSKAEAAVAAASVTQYDPLYDTDGLASMFILFLIFWAALSWPIYSLAGERMPWMTVHIAAPMILLSGWIIGKLIDGTDWRTILRRQGWMAVLNMPVALAALVQTISPWLVNRGGSRPFSGYGVGQLNATMQFLSALLVLAVALVALRWLWRQVGCTGLLRTLAVSVLALLALLTIRTAWAFAYINFDYASEFLVYAHASPDVRVAMEQIEDLSKRGSGEFSLDIGYTDDGSYPVVWYLRNYPNATKLPNPPNRQDLDKSVLLAGNAEWGGIQPYLGDNYVCRPYNFMWWPMQDYAGLSWERIRYALVNSEMRGAVWDIVFRRDYRKYERVTGKTIRLAEWPLRDGFRLCVQREFLARVWGVEASLVGSTRETGAGPTGYAGLEQPAVPELEVKGLGRFGSLNTPHGIAGDPEGFLYVADTNNQRIIKLSLEGKAVDSWDSTWWQGLEGWQPNGCLDDAAQPLALGDGQFCEPWGVAVGPEGRIYVADTWNHRVQVFSPFGEFLGKSGAFGQSGGAVASAPTLFYGPRDLAVAENGNVYVADTGNKRVQVFDRDLQYLRAFGGAGVVEGRLDEPVGVTIGTDELLYVADTWNRRVQLFTLDGRSVEAWPVAGWVGQSVLNKPYVASDSLGRVYVSDPESQRLVVFDATGAPMAVLDLAAAEGQVPPLPVGIYVDSLDRVWVSDAANHRVLRFPALSLVRQTQQEHNQP
jgi:uncharacterized protein (TIGR03663 family)